MLSPAILHLLVDVAPKLDVLPAEAVALRDLRDLPREALAEGLRLVAYSGPRSGKLYRVRSRLYRSQILQVNMRWKALAEIYTMHSFAPFWTVL